MAELPRLSIALCRERQFRLIEEMRSLGISKALLTSRENVHWLTGFWAHPLMKTAATLEIDGTCTLFAPNAVPDHYCATEAVVFEASKLCTLRQDQVAAIAGLIPEFEKVSATDFSDCPVLYRERMADRVVDLEPAVLKLRRSKDRDEVDMLRHAIGCTHAMYTRAREIITPGITELEVYSELYKAGVAAAGEPLTACGNDYQSNNPGGPPRDREAQSGELMILDLGPAYRGYHADNCRTFAVNQSPTDEQLAAFDVIKNAHELVAAEVRPGLSCRELYYKVKALLDDYHQDAFFHHLGHGIGLYPHEAPHLNPDWDESFQEGDVFAVEPGLYTDELHAGIRIEENYLVTANGIEKLTETPIEL